MTQVALPTTIEAANIVGGVDEMRVRLLNRRNLFINPNLDDFALTGTAGSTDSGWFLASGGSATKVQEHESVFGRHAAEIDDDNAGGWTYLGQDVQLRNFLVGGELNGNTTVITCWVKATSGVTDFQISINSLPSSGENTGTGYLSLTKDNWTFVAFALTYTTAGANETEIRIRFYPATNGAADLGTVRLLRPRLHVQREELTGFPRWPLRDYTYVPWSGGRRLDRNGLGQLTTIKRSMIPEIRARHPITNKAQIDQVNAAYQHDGVLLVEPTIDAPISFVMIPDPGRWDYRNLQGRAIGYSGETQFIGLDPIMGLPDTARHYETENGIIATFPDWRSVIQ